MEGLGKIVEGARKFCGGWGRGVLKAIVKGAVREEIEPIKETLAELIALLANLYPEKAGDLVLLASNLYRYREEENEKR